MRSPGCAPAKPGTTPWPWPQPAGFRWRATRATSTGRCIYRAVRRPREDAMEGPGAGPASIDQGFGRFGRWLLALSRQTAIAGGLVFVGLVAMSLASIVGRKLFALPVPGDVELL